MAIDVRVNNFSLSQSRLSHIESAKTLNDAQRMGLFDRVVDWFRGGVKGEAIKQAFDLLRSPGNAQGAQKNEHAGHEDMLFHFNLLQAALRPEHADKCKLIVQKNEGQKTWSYQMDLDGQTLVTGTDLPIGSGYTLAAFEDHAMLADFGSYLQKQYGADSADQRQALCAQFSEINARQVDLPAQDPSSAMLEKFRLINAQLEQLGGPSKACFPGVQLSSDLSSAELYIGNHVLGICQVSSQAVLTDTLKTMAHVCTSSVDYMLRARDTDAAVFATVQDMVDDLGEREVMEGKINDLFFCQANFVSATVVEGDDSKFAATFRDTAAGGAEKTLVFSNRIATNSELRGTNLQGKLADSAYSTLADLISQRFGTPEDSEIPYLTTPARFGFVNFLSSLENDGDAQDRLGFSDDAAIKDYFQNVKETVIAPMTLGNTDLSEVWGLKTMSHGTMTQEARAAPVASAVVAPAVPEARPLSPAEPLVLDMAFLLGSKA